MKRSSARRSRLQARSAGASGDEVGGKYCEDCQVAQIVPAESLQNVMSGGVREYVLNPERAKALWKKSEELVGETF